MESDIVPENLIAGRTHDTNEVLVTEGLRFDKGKLRMDLIPPEAMRGLAEVLTVGAEKYAARNWELGMDWSRCIASLKRHLLKWEEGEVYDDETGLRHLDHVLCNIVFLSTYEKRGIGNNDIPAYNKPTTAYNRT